jgi:HAD superfamily phosphoserine phosphatase-like hydrolase
MVTHSNRKSRLVVFDVEGVLMPKKRYLFFEVGRTLHFSQFLRIVFIGFLYELGLLSVKSALKRVFKAFRGIHVDELVQIFRRVPLIPGVEEVFEILKTEGCKTALISSGLPTIIVQDLAMRLRADYAIGFELEENDGILTGEIHGDVLEYRGKLPVLAKILEAEKLTPKDCVVVADDRNNVPILFPQALKIGYNPDFAVRLKADIVITGKLREILPPVKGKPRAREKQPSRNELLRESIHACGFFIPLLALYTGLIFTGLFIFVITLLYLMSELARMERKTLPVISYITYHAATQSELFEFTTAPIFFALGILLTLLLFPNPTNSAAIAIFALGDSTASIFGRMYGKRTLPFNKGKTLEGSTIGFIFAFLAGAFYITPVKALIGAIVAMLVEYLPLPVNDNFITPLVTGAVLILIK